MSTVSNSTPAPVQSVNSAISRHSPRESPNSFSGVSDQNQVLASDFFLLQVIKPPAATASFLAQDTQPEASENAGVTEKHVWNKDTLCPEVGAVMVADSSPALFKSVSLEELFQGSRTLSKDAQPEGSENAGVTEKHVWNKDSLCPEVGAVMVADSSPALFKSLSLEELFRGPLTLSKGMSDGSSSTQEVVAPNHESRSFQLSTELGVGSLNHNIATANGSFSQAPNSHSSVVEESPSNPVKSSSSACGSPRSNTHEPHQPHGYFRRNNSGPQLQGNDSFNQSYGSKRDERGKQDWSNSSRSFGGRVKPAPQQRVASTPFIRGPVSNAPFISPPPPPVAVWPYGPPVFYNDMSSFMYHAPGPHPGSLRHMPMFPFPPVFYPMTDPHLPYKIVRQIDYYFSDENLVKDTYLRQKMDVDGWVPIKLIANFKKIRELTNNDQFILVALRGSNLVEIQGEKVRRKDNWKKWILPPNMYPTGLPSMAQ